jgi:hypothetical protein
MARLDSLWLLITLATQQGWELHHLDVKSVFLVGDLQEEVFVQQSAVFVRTGEEHKVFRLHSHVWGASSSHGLECKIRCYSDFPWFQRVPI